jgi:hypothetical protein
VVINGADCRTWAWYTRMRTSSEPAWLGVWGALFRGRAHELADIIATSQKDFHLAI